MNIAMVASRGGHLTQIQKIFPKDVVGNNKTIFLTERNPKTEKLSNVYFFKILWTNPFDYLIAINKCLKIFKKEKIRLIITTGAQIGLPAVIAGKILKIKTIFIDTIIRVKTPTYSAKFCYPFSDIFLVQHPEMKEKYGNKTKYVGGIL